MTEDEMVGWHHQLNAHEFVQAPGAGVEQGGLVCCDSWGRKESDTTERLILSDLMVFPQRGLGRDREHCLVQQMLLIH